MSNVSEELSQMAANLLLQAMSALGQLGIEGARLGFEIGKEGASSLVGLINFLESQEYDTKTRKALTKLKEACKEEGTAVLMSTQASSEMPEIEKWLKKQGAVYVACEPKKKKSVEQMKDEIAAGKEPEKTTTIFFKAAEKEKLSTALAICSYKRKLINVLPPEAFFLLHDKKKDISVVDGLDFFELSIFRDLAKRYGLGYTEMENGEAQKEESVVGTYKVVCSKEDAAKLGAVMRMVSWTMTGEAADKIKEKVMERNSLTLELQKLLSDGVKDGVQTFKDEAGKQNVIENAKYIVNATNASRYVKVTAKGFYLFKGYGENDGDFVSVRDREYTEKLHGAVEGIGDYVIFDSLEWEKLGLKKINLRKEQVLEKQSVFPLEMSLENEEADMRKEKRRRQEKGEPVEESVWLFHNYDPDRTDSSLSEVIEENHNAPAKPALEAVSTHYSDAVRRAERYRYYDVENDEKTVDNIILTAKERSLGNKEHGKEPEKENEL